MYSLISSTKDLTEERRTKLAAELASWFADKVGLSTEMLFYDITGKALVILQDQVAEARQQQVADDLARRRLWAAERGMIYAGDYLKKYGINEQELKAAVGSRMLKSDTTPSGRDGFWDHVVTDRALTPEERVALSESVRWPPNHVAERLAFDHLKYEDNLQPVEMRRSRGGA